MPAPAAAFTTMAFPIEASFGARALVFVAAPRPGGVVHGPATLLELRGAGPAAMALLRKPDASLLLVQQSWLHPTRRAAAMAQTP